MTPQIDRFGRNSTYETIYLSKFKSKAVPYVQTAPGYPFLEDTTSYWGWLFMMQHYGTPTRLMDWSIDALV